MFKFSFPQAALGLTVFLSFSLGWISFQYYRQQSELVQFFQEEATGVEAAKELSLELLDFSTYQAVFRKRAVITDTLLRKTYDENLVNRSDLRNEIISTFQSIRAQNTETLNSSEIDHVNRLIKATLRSLLEQSNLILDPSFQTYYFVDALFSQLPDVIFYNYSWQELIELHLKNDHLTIKEELGIRKAAFENYQVSLKKALLESPFTPKNLHITTYASMQSAVETLASATPPLFEAFTSGRKFNQNHFSVLLSQWNGAARKVIHQGSQAFALLNQSRLQKTERALVVSLGVCLLSWIVCLIFLGFIVHSVIVSLRIMRGVIRDQRQALAKAQKLAALGEISAEIGHEIANPLTVIKATTDLLEKNFGDQQGIPVHSARIRRMVLRIEDIIRNMKTFLIGEKEGEVQPAPVNLKKILEEVEEDAQPRLEVLHAQLEIKYDNTADAKVLGNHGEFVQVFTILLANAMDAIKDSPVKEINIRVYSSEAFTEVEIQDSGKGIPAEIKDHIFEALFTTKKTGEGTGLGLSIAQKIINKYQGRLTLLDKGPGACFEVSLNRDTE